MSGEPPRLFAPELPREGGEVALAEEAARHARVLRLSPGDRVRLFDGDGSEADARIVSVEPRTVLCAAEPARAARADSPRLVLVQVIPRGRKLDGIVRMTTELGVAEVRLALSQRSQKRSGPLERLERIARESARQARRATVPRVTEPRPLLEVAAAAPVNSLKIVAWETAAQALEPTLPATVDAWLVVGAEGGLAEVEVERLEQLGYRAIGLGPTILRVETAAPVAVALVLDRVRR